MQGFEEEIVDNDEVSKTVNEIKIKIKEDKFKIDSIKDLKKVYPDKSGKLEEILFKYMGKMILKF